MITLVHKSKPRAAEIGRRSMCGQYGKVTMRWAAVTCPACLRLR